MDFRKKLIVAPGSKFRLASVNPTWHGKDLDEATAKADLTNDIARLTKLQYELYAERRHAVLIVLQGIDAAGKDGTCWHVMTAMNPQGARVVGFKQPTPIELAHNYLWRIHRETPGKGEVVVFNRSHYEDVLVVRVHNIVPKSVWSRRYDEINAFEKLLTDSGTTILKFFLLISPEEQLARFKQRLDDPARQWKISESDYSERAKWDDYGKAYEAMLRKCSTEHAPWYVIPANHKWFRNFAVSRILADTLSDLKMQMPKPTVDIEAVRALYHAAANGSPK